MTIGGIEQKYWKITALFYKVHHLYQLSVFSLMLEVGQKLMYEYTAKRVNFATKCNNIEEGCIYLNFLLVLHPFDGDNVISIFRWRTI